MSMKIGNHTCTHYPSKFTIPRPDRINSYELTYEGVVHFSWGLTIIGKVIEISWNYLPSTEFDNLDAVFQADAEIEWDPGIPEQSDTYTAQILDFTGDYFESTGSAADIYRENCMMRLLITGLIPESS